jgi:hypothetical protein
MPSNLSRSLIRFSVSLCLMSACAHGTGPMSGVTGIRASSGLDFTETWERALNNLYFKGYPIKNADRKSGTIVTDKKAMLLDVAAADCPEFRVFPYIENKRAIKYVSQTIVIGSGEQATIHVVSSIDGVPDESRSDEGKRLSCISRGVLERELVAEIVSPQQSSQAQ